MIVQTPNRPQRVELSLFSRFWTLCLLGGLSENGLAPNTRKEIFSFAYLACAVASKFHVESVQHAVLKNEEGPHLLVVSRALDKLIAAGLVNVHALRATSNAKMVEGQYLISDRGLTVMARSMQASNYLRPIAEFLRDVTYAFGNLSPEEITYATKLDASFADLAVPSGEVVDLGEWEPGNKTTQILDVLRAHTQRIYSGDPLAACQIYARYLDVQKDNQMNEGVGETA